MRHLALFLAVLLPLLGPARALADDDDDEPNAFVSYLIHVVRTAAVGLNGVVTAPADPVLAARDIEPMAMGIGAGLLQMPYRMVMGVLDVALCPVPLLPVLSPVPRVKAIPWFEHPEE
jgi:hypothetical protein